MIDKYLKSLLADNKRVIIPDFGGFVVKRSAAGDIISFNSFLKFNDDLLANLIVDKEKVTKDQALKSIKVVVGQINTSLDTEGKFEIDEVGFLIKDKKGNVRFVDEIDDVVASMLPSLEEKGTVASKSKTEKPNDRKEVEESATKTSVAPPVVVEPIEQSTPPVVKDENSQQKKTGIFWLLLILLFLAVGAWAISHYVFNKEEGKAQVEVIKSEGTNDGLVEQITQQHSELVKHKADDQMNVTVSSHKKGFFERLIDFFKRLFSKKDKALDVENQEKTSNAALAVMQPNQVDTINGILVVADKLIAPKGDEGYNVIIGSFEERVNALKFKDELVNNGYPSLVFERYNGFQAVSMGAFPSLDIALKVCEEELESTPDVWILVK